MRTTLLVPFLGLALTAATPSQCLFTSVSAQPVGQGCNSGHTGLCMIPGFPSTLIPELDTTNCELDVTVTALVGCGGVTVPLRVLAVGFLPTFVPLSMFGSGCALQVDPIALLASTGPPLTVALPPGVATFGFLAQGVAWSQFAPLPDILAFTAPFAISLQ